MDPISKSVEKNSNLEVTATTQENVPNREACIGLARIDQYPERFQSDFEARWKIASELESALLLAFDEIKRLGRVHDFSAPEPLSNLGRSLEDRKLKDILTNLERASELLLWSDQNLNKDVESSEYIQHAGKIVSEVLEEDYQPIFFNEDRAKRFARTINPLRWFVRRKDKRFQKSLADERDNQKKELTRIIETTTSIPISSVRRILGEQEAQLNKIVSDIDNREEQQDFQKLIHTYKHVASQYQNSLLQCRLFQRDLSRWLERNKAKFSALKLDLYQESSFMDRLEMSLDLLDQDLESRQKKIDSIESMIKKRIKSVIVENLKSIRENLSKLHSTVLVRPNGYEFVDQATLPQEYEEMVNRLNNHFEALANTIKSLGNSDAVQIANNDVTKTFKSIRIILENSRKENASFPDSKRTLWHTSSYDTVVHQILGSGILASREAQIQKLGKSNVQTGGDRVLSMTADAVTVVDYSGRKTELTHQEFSKWQKQHDRGGKSILQESHQVCFSEGYYDRRYFDGVALVFSSPQLLADRQFMFSDGVHVFDRDYRTGIKQTPGLSLDLTSENFLCVVKQDKKEQFLADLRAMFQKEPWKSLAIDVEKWIEQHVVVIESGEDATKREEMINNAFSRLNLHRINEGVFVPTGERGETATRNWERTFMYQTQVYGEKKSVESRLNVDKVKDIFSKETCNDIDIQEVIKEISNDKELSLDYQSGVGVMERYTLSEHTRMFFNIFEKYFAKNLSPKIKQSFRLFLLFHDIGKPDAIRVTGSKRDQHQYTVKKMERFLPQFGLSTEEIEFWKRVVNQDVLGDYMKGNIDEQRAYEVISELSNRLKIPLDATFELLKMYYMSDAASYTLEAGRGLEGIRAKEGLDHLFLFNHDLRAIHFSDQADSNYWFSSDSPHGRFAKLENLCVTTLPLPLN